MAALHILVSAERRRVLDDAAGCELPALSVWEASDNACQLMVSHYDFAIATIPWGIWSIAECPGTFGSSEAARKRGRQRLILFKKKLQQQLKKRVTLDSSVYYRSRNLHMIRESQLEASSGRHQCVGPTHKLTPSARSRSHKTSGYGPSSV